VDFPPIGLRITVVDRLLLRLLSFGLATLLAILSARLVAQDPRYAAVMVFVLLAFAIPAWLARRRMRRVLLSGDIGRILRSWQGSLGRVTYPETMAPLMTATAYAAYGFIEEARGALDRAARGPAWEAAVEQRLMVEALLDVYEGERDLAISKAEAIERLPLPQTGFRMRRKIAVLRRGIGALARAFAHTSRPEDDGVLREASRSSPLVHWAMRYGRAVVLVDAGKKGEARDLLEGAPSWPEQSAFRAFHDELLSAARETAI
jgi:hypothetical protein